MPSQFIAPTVFLFVFWVPSILYILHRVRIQLRSETVPGTIVKIEPVYKSVKYTFEIHLNGQKELATMTPNTAFQLYKMGEQVTLYRDPNTDVMRKYYIKESFYTAPIVIMTVSGFLALMFYFSVL